MTGLRSDVLHAWRSLRRTPGITLLAIATLSVAIGANTAIFSFVHALLLKALPYAEPERLVRIESVRGGERGRVSIRDLDDVRAELRLFEGVASYMPGAQYNVSEGGVPEEIPATMSDHNLFEVLGVRFLLGGSWPAAFDRSRSFGVVLSHDLWRNRFGGDSSVLGKTITLDGYPGYTIYGVLPAGLHFPARAQLFRSIGTRFTPNLKDRDARDVLAVARLAKGVSFAEAEAALRGIGERLARDFPSTNAGVGLGMTPVTELTAGPARPYIVLLFGAVGFVLLIACTNVTSLLLARAFAEWKSTAIRAALGASPFRLARQRLAQSLTIAAAGGVVGTALAFWWVSLLRKMIRVDLPAWVRIAIEGRVLVFAALVAIVSGVLAGLAPAWKARRTDLSAALRESERGSTAGPASRLRRGAFVVGEVALAMILLVGAGLMAKSFVRLSDASLGFDPRRLLTFRVALAWKTYERPEQISGFHRRALERLREVPGVSGAALDSDLHLGGAEDSALSTVYVEGRDDKLQTRNPYVRIQDVDSEFFPVMGLPVLRGRALSPDDRADRPRVAVVSDSLARRLWPGEEVIGRRIREGGPSAPEPAGPDDASPWMTVVGVVADLPREHLTGEADLDLYTSYLQGAPPNVFYVLRTRVAPEAVAAAATRALWSVDPHQSIFDSVSMEDRVERHLWRQRVSASLLLAFAALALLFSAVGIYGVISQAVSQRVREIGVRMTLGASPGRILGMVLGEALTLAGIGAVLGTAGAAALVRTLGHVLYGVSLADPLVYAAVLAILGAVAVGAAALPAWRAARLAPLDAVREAR